MAAGPAARRRVAGHMQAAALRAIGYAEYAARQSAARREGRYIGIGLAHAVKGTGPNGREINTFVVYEKQ